MFSIKTGLFQKKFPTHPKVKTFITLKEWKDKTPPFFFYGKNINGLTKIKSKELEKIHQEFQEGTFTFFSKKKYNLGNQYDWLTNPETNYTYEVSKHWTQIQDISETAGDIKFVWEKARFSFLYDIIRYDYHFDEDQSEFVFTEIIDFIEKNPINQGPNYKCSQEISLRVLNWTFALYYYKDSLNLTDAVFNKIMNSIYWQLHHVYHNIHFSRIAVRNNHAITETLMLYLSNKLFPFIPETKQWSKKGKQWFEQEVAYQIYEDGTFLQFSMNYHRVAVQLLTWAIRIAKLNKETFDEVVYQKAVKSLSYLDVCKDPLTGKLPNYGSNDGALFFKLTDDHYRNYRSQLDDLRAVLNNTINFKTESIFWYGITNVKQKPSIKPPFLNLFKNGGYYIIQEDNTKTFIKCGSYKDRPAQSDNLHIDIWVDGINYLRDSGSYKYNTKKEYLDYFNGCEGHNTVSISEKNQMQKGDRFIWYNWIKEASSTLIENEKTFEFDGKITAFKELGDNIEHQRIIIKEKAKNNWTVIDNISNKGNKKMHQYWQINPKYKKLIKIRTFDEKDNEIEPIIEGKWYSSHYGIKEESIRISFETSGKIFKTTICIKTQ